MTTPRSLESRLDAFLDEGETDLPDRAFDAVRNDIHRTRQRVVIGPWREPTMSPLLRAALAAAAAVAIVIAGFTLIQRPSGAGVGPTPIPTATPQAIPPDSALLPGRYVFKWANAAGVDPGDIGPSMAITIPSDGWTSYATFAADKNLPDGGAGVSFLMWKVVYRYVDPCGTAQMIQTPLPGPTVDDLMAGLSGQPGFTSGAPKDVVIDGYLGKSIDLTAVTDIDTCSQQLYPFNDKYIQGNGELNRVYAVDVDGFRLTFDLRIPAAMTPADRALLDVLVASIDIAPYAP
ncbi:MAG: hypothetical protein ABIV26_03515 [Candidatus Limnocylindrales bacterium]